MNKETRNQIYKRAKEIYANEVKRVKENINGCMSFGMCHSILTAAVEMRLLDNRNSVFGSKFKNMFPEFSDLKPSDMPNNCFWWDIHDTKIRIKMFNLIIKATK